VSPRAVGRDEAAAVLAAAHEVVLLAHVDPDADALGSALALEPDEARGLGFVWACARAEHIAGGRQEEVESIIDVRRALAAAPLL
jgi:hypothetical protein